MKRKDMYLVGTVAVVAAIFGYLISNLLFGSAASRQTTVPVVTPITTTFPVVKNDAAYKTIFNSQAIDPTQLIRIGGQTNSQPFTGQ